MLRAQGSLLLPKAHCAGASQTLLPPDLALGACRALCSFIPLSPGSDEGLRPHVLKLCVDWTPAAP